MIPHQRRAIAAFSLLATLSAWACNDLIITPDRVISVVVVPSMPPELTALGQTVSLSATAANGDGSSVVNPVFLWESSDSSVMTVDQSGVATAVGNGATFVTATLDGIQGVSLITVQQVATQLSLSGVATTGVRATLPSITVQIQDANGFPVPSSNDPVTMSIGTNPGNAVMHASGVNDTDRYLEYVDPVAAAVVTPELSIDGVTGETLALAYDAAGGLMYRVSDQAQLDSVDLRIGVGRTIATIPGAPTISALSFDGSGSLVAAQPGSAELLTVDPATADTTSLGTVTVTGDAVSGIHGLALEPGTGVMWAALDVASGGGRRLATIDLGTFVATLVGPLGQDGVSGITFLSDGTLLAVTDDGATSPETLWTVDTASGGMTSAVVLGNGGQGEAIEAVPAVLTGSVVELANAGVATFTDLSINGSGTGFTLVASVAGLPDVESVAFDITP